MKILAIGGGAYRNLWHRASPVPYPWQRTHSVRTITPETDFSGNGMARATVKIPEEAEVTACNNVGTQQQTMEA
ncbi:MAG: hypothetical protein ABSG02_09575 [Terriglobales bacterium]|jgi:hypothetical protein